MIASGDGEMGTREGEPFLKKTMEWLLKQCRYMILIKRLAYGKTGFTKDKQDCIRHCGRKQTPNPELRAGAGNTSTNDRFSLRISLLLDQWHLSFTGKETEAKFTKDQS